MTDQSRMTIDELLSVFRTSTIRYFELMNEGASEAAIDYVADILWPVTTEIAGRSQEDRLKMTPMLQDDHPAVRLYAARELEELMPREAISIYEALSFLRSVEGMQARSSLDAVLGIDPFKGPPPFEF